MIRASLAAAALAAPAQAQTYFAAPDRSVPIFDDPSGVVIGELHPGARPVEGIGADETGVWVRIGQGELEGWVEASDLEQIEVETLRDSAVPLGLICSGTEPFWAMRLGETSALDRPGAAGDRLELRSITKAEGREAFPVALRYGDVTAVLRHEACSDGMSGRTYLWRVDVLRAGELHTGCCRLSEE